MRLLFLHFLTLNPLAGATEHEGASRVVETATVRGMDAASEPPGMGSRRVAVFTTRDVPYAE